VVSRNQAAYKRFYKAHDIHYEPSIRELVTGAPLELSSRLQTKYGIRGYRFALLDVGHVSQNIYLVGTALGVQVCASAGFIDDTVDQALGLDGLDTASMLVVLVGR
jgi:nitroreductase